MTPFAIAHSIRRYAGKIKTIRGEIRTRRFLDSLPPEMRRDIGWPDRFGSPCIRD